MSDLINNYLYRISLRLRDMGTHAEVMAHKTTLRCDGDFSDIKHELFAHDVEALSDLVSTMDKHINALSYRVEKASK